MGGHGPGTVDLEHPDEKDDPGRHHRRRYRESPIAIGSLLDIDIPAPAERGGNISSREIVARGLAAIDPALARNLTASTHMSFYNGTITWRENWWRAIWPNSQANYTNLLIGPGYGYLMKNMVSYLKDFRDLRTPHIFLLRAGLQRLAWGFAVLLLTGCLRRIGVARLQNHWPVLWRCDLGVDPVHCILR
jgi:hypothetical protein